MHLTYTASLTSEFKLKDTLHLLTGWGGYEKRNSVPYSTLGLRTGSVLPNQDTTLRTDPVENTSKKCYSKKP
jgi:hypothetical protein